MIVACLSLGLGVRKFNVSNHPNFGAQDLAPFGIRVNAVSPALIGPGMMWTRQNELHAQSGSPYFATDPEVVAQNKIAK